MGKTYKTIGTLVGFVAFAVSWLYCILTYGFLIGVTLGWIPGLIVGFIAGVSWPIVILLGFYLYNLIFPNYNSGYLTSGNGLTVTNTAVEKTAVDSCRYKLEEKNSSETKQNMNVRIYLLSQDGSKIGDFSWDLKPLYTGSPKIDNLVNAPCPAYAVKNGASKIEYVLSDYPGNIIVDKSIDVSTKYTDNISKEANPSPTP